MNSAPLHIHAWAHINHHQQNSPKTANNFLDAGLVAPHFGRQEVFDSFPIKKNCKAVPKSS